MAAEAEAAREARAKVCRPFLFYMPVEPCTIEKGYKGELLTSRN